MSLSSFVKTRLLHPLGIKKLSFKEKLAPEVERRAAELLKNHRANTSDNAAFIDMGSNVGQGFSYFSQFYSPNHFDYFLFEPNPNCIPLLEKHLEQLYQKHHWQGQRNIHNAAVAAEDGTLEFFGVSEDDGRETSTGASIVKEHNSAYYDAETFSPAVSVQAQSASKLISDLASSYATIVVKMDIECAEYDVLESLIESGMIDKIDFLYIEWHAKYCSEEERATFQKREDRLREQMQGKFLDWQ